MPPWSRWSTLPHLFYMLRNAEEKVWRGGPPGPELSPMKTRPGSPLCAPPHNVVARNGGLVPGQNSMVHDAAEELFGRRVSPLVVRI